MVSLAVSFQVIPSSCHACVNRDGIGFFSILECHVGRVMGDGRQKEDLSFHDPFM